MKNVKLLNGLLWIFNILLGAGIVLFSINFLLQKDSPIYRQPEITVPSVTKPPTPPNYGVLKLLGNPLERVAADISSPVARSFAGKLTSTMPNPDPALAAVVLLIGGNRQVLCWIGTEIELEGKIVDELRGWKLVDVLSDRASFSNGRETIAVTRDDGIPGASPLTTDPTTTGRPTSSQNRPSTAGTAYDPNAYARSRLVRDEPNFKHWELDPEELKWIADNFEQVLERDFAVRPNVGKGGGIIIDSVRGGTVGACRGLDSNHVIRSINGNEIKSLEDVKRIREDLATRKNDRTLRLTVDNGGAPLVLQYTVAPVK